MLGVDVQIERSLDIGVLAPSRAARGRGVLGHTITPGLGTVRTDPASGLRLTSPATTWAMMGALLDRDDLVAVGDAFVRVAMRSDDPPALATVAELAAALQAGRRHGADALREALPLIRTRSRSRQETRLRLRLVGTGFPEPELNWPFVQGGLIVALLDLAYPEWMLALEYEGEHHLTDPEQWAADIRRHDMLVDAGWRVIRVTKTDLATGWRALAARVSAAIAART